MFRHPSRNEKSSNAFTSTRPNDFRRPLQNTEECCCRAYKTRHYTQRDPLFNPWIAHVVCLQPEIFLLFSFSFSTALVVFKNLLKRISLVSWTLLLCAFFVWVLVSKRSLLFLEILITLCYNNNNSKPSTINTTRATRASAHHRDQSAFRPPSFLV